MTALRVLAPAKINWTLEVLGKHPDGYHEIRSILQTIDLCDQVTLRPADDITLSIGDEGDALAAEPIETNLAYRAASLLRGASSRGVQITLEKHIPIAAGLGGGSSDAAAVLRGLVKLWDLELTDEELSSLAGQLGSDVPFFLRGGTALASGRGEIIEQLPDVPEQRLIVAWKKDSAEENKTAAMYRALESDHYTDGTTTEEAVVRIRAGEVVRNEDLFNVFERVRNMEGTSVELNASSPSQFPSMIAHLCGSGPAVFFPVPLRTDANIERKLPPLIGLTSILTQTIGADEATRIEEFD